MMMATEEEDHDQMNRSAEQIDADSRKMPSKRKGRDRNDPRSTRRRKEGDVDCMRYRKNDRDGEQSVGETADNTRGSFVPTSGVVATNFKQKRRRPKLTARKSATRSNGADPENEDTFAEIGKRVSKKEWKFMSRISTETESYSNEQILHRDVRAPKLTARKSSWNVCVPNLATRSLRRSQEQRVEGHLEPTRKIQNIGSNAQELPAIRALPPEADDSTRVGILIISDDDMNSTESEAPAPAEITDRKSFVIPNEATNSTKEQSEALCSTKIDDEDATEKKTCASNETDDDDDEITLAELRTRLLRKREPYAPQRVNTTSGTASLVSVRSKSCRWSREQRLDLYETVMAHSATCRVECDTQKGAESGRAKQSLNMLVDLISARVNRSKESVLRKYKWELSKHPQLMRYLIEASAMRLKSNQRQDGAPCTRVDDSQDREREELARIVDMNDALLKLKRSLDRGTKISLLSSKPLLLDQLPSRKDKSKCERDNKDNAPSAQKSSAPAKRGTSQPREEKKGVRTVIDLTSLSPLTIDPPVPASVRKRKKRSYVDFSAASSSSSRRTRSLPPVHGPKVPRHFYKTCLDCGKQFSSKAFEKHLINDMCNLEWERQETLRAKQARLFQNARNKMRNARLREMPALERSFSNSSDSELCPVANDAWLSYWNNWRPDTGSPHACLGFVDDGAVTLRDVKSRFRRLAKLVHPDKCRSPYAASAFDSITKAKCMIESTLAR